MVFAYFSTGMFFFLLNCKRYICFNDILYRLIDIYCKYFPQVVIVVALLMVFLMYRSFLSLCNQMPAISFMASVFDVML